MQNKYHFQIILHLILIGLFLNVITANAQTSQEKRRVIRGFNLQTENDVFASLFGLKNEDKDYSGGFKFEFYTDYLRKGIFPLFRNRKNDSLNLNSIYIQGLGFTPNRDAFSSTEPVLDQRPYASILGIGWKRIAKFNKGRFRNSTVVSDILIGQVGTDLPGNFQNFLHANLTNSDTVKGWNNQIGNGGRWIFNYKVKAIIKLTDKDNDNTIFDKERKSNLFLEPHISLGTLFVNAGAKLSVSNLSSDGLGIFSPMGSSKFVREAARKKETKEGFRNEGNFFKKHFSYEAYVAPQYVMYNTLLMGLPVQDNSIYIVPKSQVSKILTDIGGKIMFHYYPDDTQSRFTTVYLELIWRSKEFEYGETHIFGNIGVTIFNL